MGVRRGVFFGEFRQSEVVAERGWVLHLGLFTQGFERRNHHHREGGKPPWVPGRNRAARGFPSSVECGEHQHGDQRLNKTHPVPHRRPKQKDGGRGKDVSGYQPAKFGEARDSVRNRRE